MHPRPHPHRPTTTAIALALTGLLAAVGTVAGCGEDEPSSPPPGGGTTVAAVATTVPAPDTSAPPTSEPATDEEAVLAAVDCYWTTIVEANDPPDPDHPGFARCFTGAALERSRGRTEEHKTLGHRVVDPSGSTARSDSHLELDRDLATMTECVVDDAVVLDAASGRVLNDEVVSGHVRLTLERFGSRWLVVNATLLDEVEGSQACDTQ